MTTVPAVDQFVLLAHAMGAEMPDLVARLLADHPNVDGLCPGCSIPGGVIRVAAPCSLHKLARLARQVASEPSHRTTRRARRAH